MIIHERFPVRFVVSRFSFHNIDSFRRLVDIFHFCPPLGHATIKALYEESIGIEK